jgi:hypothetical protein
MAYYQIRNWESFQHYKDRNPPWIKLHRELLTSETWIVLDDASRVLAVACMLVAAATDNKIPANPAYLKRVAYLNEEPNMQALVDTQFIEFIEEIKVASTVLADCKQNARPEAEAETEKNTYVASKAADQCPHQKIIDLYHEVLPMCPRVRDWTPARATQLRARWNEDQKRQNLDYWRTFFEYVAGCDFLVGKSGKEPFFADLEWCIKSKNFTKIREGKYENRQ